MQRKSRESERDVDKREKKQNPRAMEVAKDSVSGRDG